MRRRALFFAVAALMALGCGVTGVKAEGPPALWDFTDDPSGNAGALKDRVETGGGYSAHNGNASRSVTDLEVPGGLGAYGLDFTRHWNSTDESFSVGGGHALRPFGNGGWTHSWNWIAVFDHEIWICEPENGPCVGNQTDRRMMQINYPDGRTAKFSFSRTDGRDIHGNYSAHPEGYPWAEHWGGDPAVNDHLRGMDPNGSAFWLFLADGGSVRFERTGFYYRATQVIDPHGLKTILDYDVIQNGYEIPLLTKVEQPGGRSLHLTWRYFPGQFCPVISTVQTGTGQRVDYGYNPFSKDGHDLGYALTSVTYVNDPDPVTGQPIQASYIYTPHVAYDPQYTQVIRGLGPLLAEANDPRFMGPMRRIHYIFRGGPCGQEPFPNDPCGAPFYPIATDDPQGGENIDFFHMKPFPIQAELSAETGQTVSQLFIPQNRDGRIYPEVGTRTETRGAGGSRVFYYGSKCGLEPGGHFVNQTNNPYWEPPEAAPGGYRAFQLGKVTDFADDPASAPFDFQRHQVHKPWRIFDGRKLLTQLKWVPWTGRVSEVWHRGSDTFNGNLSKRTYNWTDPRASVAQNFTFVPNFYSHWLFSQVDEGGNETVYTRDERRRVRTIQYPAGSTEEYQYNEQNQVIQHRLASHTEQDRAEINYDYDFRHRLWREWNTVDGQPNATIYTYDELDRVKTISHAWSRNKNADFSVKMTYNARHQVVMEEYPATNGGAPTKEYRYDRYGNCIAIKNELGAWSTYEYDEYRRCTSYTEPLNAPNWQGAGTVASRTWKWHYDRYSDATGPRGASTHTSKQWRVQVEPAFNAAEDRRLSARKFDYSDRIIEEITGMIERTNGDWATTADTEVRLFTYDANGNKKTFVDSRGRTTEYEYDQRDRLVKTTEHPMPNASPSAARVTEMSYDRVGNKLSVKFPDQTLQRWELYDPFGQARRFIDERNQPTDLTYQWGPMKKLNTLTTYRTRDPASGGGLEPQLTDFNPDPLGRPREIIFPDQTKEVITYKYGQVETFKTRKNQIKNIVYDARGREEYHSWVGEAAPWIRRVWDDANRLSWIKNIFSEIDYKYDDAGQVWWEGNTIAGSGVPMQTKFYRYPSGQVGYLQHPHGLRLRKAYTARGQLQTIGLNDSANRLVDYYYLPDGKVDYSTYWNGVSTTRYGYDGRGMINSIHHLKTTESPQGPSLAFRQYWRDSRDRITAWQRGTDTRLNGKEVGDGDKFQYDAEGQLTDAWYLAQDPGGNMHSPLVQEHFQYDQLGNRFGSNQTISYGTIDFLRRDNGLNQYASWTPSVIYHDDNHPGWTPPGNGVLMADGYITASYNALNQPIAIWSPTPAGTSNYTWFGFDPLGRCVKRWVGPLVGGGYPPPETNPATYFLYDGWNMIEEGPGGGGVARVYAHGARVDEIIASSNEFGAVLFHHYDALGNCILLSDGAGNLFEQYDYEAFGKPYFYNTIGTNIPESTWKNRYLGKGREWLADLKLYDYRHRLYQPELGRFLQPDPKHFEAGDYNLYRYCHNDPVNKSDPTGLTDQTIRMSDPKKKSMVEAHLKVLRGIPAFAAKFQETDAKSRPSVIRDAQDWLNPARRTPNGLLANTTVPGNGFNLIGLLGGIRELLGAPGPTITIFYDPTNNMTESGKIREPIFGLANEIGEMFSIYDGTFGAGGPSASDNRSIKWENIARDALGVDARALKPAGNPFDH